MVPSLGAAGMSQEVRRSEPLADLPLRLNLEPTPVEGCEVCRHAVAWRWAYRTGRGTPDGYTNQSAASECNAEIRNHPHEPRVMALPIKPPAVAS